MTFAHQLGIILGFVILAMLAMPYLAAGADAVARWVVGL
tara:strand:- start:35771 stop:35887 length:117 start_codon:yes stop_codon:yes gene_type:complete